MVVVSITSMWQMLIVMLMMLKSSSRVVAALLLLLHLVVVMLEVSCSSGITTWVLVAVLGMMGM